MIEFKNVSKKYKDKVALSNCSLQIPKGQIIGLFGANGAGKTTFMKCMMGYLNFDGEINAADARDIMRLAVGLDTLFDKVPEGQKIKIVKIEEDIEDDDDDDDENPLVGPDGKPLPFVGLFDQYDPAIKLTDIVEAVFKYIGMVENTEGDARNYIQEFIDAITKAVGENDNP